VSGRLGEAPSTTVDDSRLWAERKIASRFGNRFERRLLRKAGEVVHLTPTEFDVLALLMRNQGMPVTHVKLLRTVWGPEYGEELEYLRAYVKTLRKKIEADPAQPKYILTEPWVGYRFHNPSDSEQSFLDPEN
jgi:two-component system KDP operon response regulator KdpE